jgi:glycosyltransferase involved in cell wall biosynthesis
LDARPPRLSRDEALAAIGADAGRVVVVCVANLERRKGQEHLLRALASLREMPGPTPQIVLEGEGPDSSRLRALISDLGLERDALMPGRLAYVPDFMAAADVIVLPSVDQEDFPNVILEAMAYGKPVIASALAGIPEQVVDGETGVLVPPRDEKALAEALRKVAADATLRRQLGEAGKVRHAALYTAGAAASRWADVYRDLLPGSSSR